MFLRLIIYMNVGVLYRLPAIYRLEGAKHMLNRITNAVNIINVISHRTVSIIDVEKYYTHTNRIETPSLEYFLSDIQNHADTMEFRYRNMGKGYLKIYGISPNNQYQYKVIMYVENPLRRLNDVINELGYAVYPANRLSRRIIRMALFCLTVIMTFTD